MRQLTHSDFIKKAITVHNDKYDYSETKYIGCRTPVKILCHKHGLFTQLPYQHLQGKGCKKCGFDKIANDRVLSLVDFIEKANKIHLNKYDYSNVKQFKNEHAKINILCRKHGIFRQSVNAHLCGKGCKKCVNEKMSKERMMSVEQFKLRSSKIHNSKYGYDNIHELFGNKEKVEITCKKHGIFRQSPSAHLRGQGCPKCKKFVLKDGYVCDSMTEVFYLLHLQSKSIPFVHNKRYPLCSRRIKYDFYLPLENKYVEVTGFNDRYMKITPEIRSEYLKNIEWKREFVEKTLKAKFQFLELTLSQKEIYSVVEKLI